MRRQRQVRQNTVELGKQASAVARALSLRTGRVLPSPPGLHRVVVEGGDLTRPAVLCVRAGPDWSGDGGTRFGVDSEHVAVVRELTERAVRGKPVYSRLVEYLPVSLRRRLAVGPLSVGEVVTVLLAVADVMQAAHRSGHGGVGPRVAAIRFRDDGCPVLAEFEGIGALTHERAHRDAAAFLTLVRELTRSVPGGAGAKLLADVEAFFAAGVGSLREILLSGAPPEALRLSLVPAVEAHVALEDGVGAVRSAASSYAAGVVAGQRAHRREGRGRRSAASGRRGSRAGGSMSNERWELILDGHPVREARAAVVRFARRRPRAVLVGALPLVVATVVFASLPQAGGAPAGPDSGTAAAATGPSGSIGLDSQAECAEPDLFDLTGGSDPGCTGPSDEEAVAGSDDPAQVALAWLSARAVEAGGLPAESAEVTQRWGEAVLVRIDPQPEGGANSEPASLLLVRGEAGWRVRAVYS